jgi:(p)ppGpp synthase/HD superfamily hydrolase
MTTPTLEDAIALAVESHHGQTDKVGQPYILHPLRVMLAVHGEAARMAAVLHDVVEDCGVTLDDLRVHGYPEDVVQAVDCLTRREGESYEAFVDRLAPNPLARCVKLADLEDNLDVRRLPAVTEKDQERLNRYLAARARLLDYEPTPRPPP